MWQFAQAYQLVGSRLLACATAPSGDWFCSLFCTMIMKEFCSLILFYQFSHRGGQEQQRKKAPKTSAGRHAVVSLGALWGAQLASELGASPDVHQQSTLAMMLIAWFILIGRLSIMLAQVGRQARHSATIDVAQTSMFVLTLGLYDLFHKPALFSVSISKICTISITALLLAALLTMSHGPDESSGCRPVDREHTCSLFERLTFMWARTILTPAKMKEAKLKDLPDLRLDFKMKNRSLPELHGSPGSSSVGAALAYSHAFPLLLQCTLAVLDSFVSLAPEIITFKLLNWLASDTEDSKLFGVFLGVALGASKLASITVNSWLKWVTATRVFIPIQSSMIAMMYRKAMRIRDGTNFGSTKPGVKDDTLLEMRSRCANACEFYTDFHKIVVILTKVVISVHLLLKLLGWQCLVAGVVVTAVSMPLRTVISRRYSKTLAATTQLHEEQSAILSQALLCIRQIKLAAEEQNWRERLRICREKELANILSSAVWMTILVFASDISPIILAGVPIYIFTLLGNPLGSSVAFTSINLFKEVQHAMSALPMIIPYQWNYWTELKRLEDFLNRPEIHQTIAPGDSVSFINATVSWCSVAVGRKQFVLEDISANFPVGELSLITGKTGSGKSLLLASIAGEARLLSGTICRPCPLLGEKRSEEEAERWLRQGQVAFVTQNVWMSNDTIQQNIIFGSPFNLARYNSVLYACALEKDLSTFKNGDRTVIGIKGTTISGGQRWRIALARALYSRATVLLLDDVLSAVDAEVREWIITNALCGNLAQGRTRILITHHTRQLLGHAVYQIELSNGSVTVCTLEEKQTNTVNFALQLDLPHCTVSTGDDEEASSDDHTPARKKFPSHEVASKSKLENKQDRGYKLYYDATGGILTWAIALLTILASESTALCASWWLKQWTSLDTAEQLAHTHKMSPATIYMLISSLSCIISAARCFVWYLVGVKGSRALSSIIVDRIFGANLQWLESTSHGEILTAFGDEMELVDDRLPHALGFVIENAFAVAFIIFTNASFSLYGAPLVGLLFYIFINTGLNLLSVQRSLRTMQNSSVSTIQQHLSSLQAPDGITTIRSYGVTKQYVSHMYELMDDRYAAYWNFSLCNTMIGFQFGALGALYVLLSSLCIVMAGANAGSAGMALTFASRLSDTISSSLRRMAAVESDLQSVEQIMRFRDVEQEPRDGAQMSSSWPVQGTLRVDKLTVGYGEGTANTLEDISFSIDAGERVGVVGRTGAGKSSLTLAFARLIQRRSGTICIDGVDIHGISLDVLRQGLLIIPQDVHLGVGTLRSLLDPDSQHNDLTLLEYLDTFHFSSTTTPTTHSTSDEILSMQVSGKSLSPGQRQIVSLIRAVLADRKIIIMDEATSAVDMETEEAIQGVLQGRGKQSMLKDATIVMVAHRIATVADMDKVLVLEDGKLAEFGAPKALYQQHGTFWKLVNHSVDKEQLVREHGW